jgi:alpha-beta hydrolase superfamily lysophospholipase
MSGPDLAGRGHAGARPSLFRPGFVSRRGPGLALALALVLALGACAPRLAPLGTGAASPALLDERFRAADGVELPLRSWMPEDEPEAVILAVHGFNDYSNAFTAPGGFLAERGIATYAFDQRGFGEAPHRGLWPGGQAMVRDLADVARILRQRHAGTPFYLLGDSMGAAVVLAAMAARSPPEVDGVILVAPAVWAREVMNPLQSGALWLAAHTVPWLKLTGRSLKIRASDNIEMLRALAQDPLVIKETRIDAIFGLINLMDRAMEAAPRVSVPALVLYGDNDEVIPSGPILELLGRLPTASAPRWGAAFYERGFHMLLRDLQAEVVLEDVIAWIEDPAKSLPSGADAHAAEALAAD